MDKTKQTLAIALVAVLAVLAGGWFLLVSPQRSSAASLNEEKVAQDQKNAQLQTKISQLKSELVELPAAKAALEAVARRLPPDLAQVSLIQSLTKAAKVANVDLQSIMPGSPTLAAPAAAAVVVAPTTTASTAGGGTAGGAAAAAPAVPANPNQLYAIPLSLTIAGDYFDVEMFIHNLEGMQRALLVNQLTIAKSASAAAPLAAGGTSAAGVSGSAKKAAGKTTAKGSSKSGGSAANGAGTKPVPGSAAAAQAAAGAELPFVTDANTLTVTVSAQVFSMYSSAPAAASIVTSAPTQ